MPSHHPPTTSAEAQINALTSAQYYAALTQQYCWAEVRLFIWAAALVCEGCWDGIPCGPSPCSTPENCKESGFRAARSRCRYEYLNNQCIFFNFQVHRMVEGHTVCHPTIPQPLVQQPK